MIKYNILSKKGKCVSHTLSSGAADTMSSLGWTIQTVKVAK